jgi:transcription elongation factor GreA
MKTDPANRHVKLSEAALSFLSSMPPEDQKQMQQEVNRFILWYGREQDITKITVNEVAKYAEAVMASDAEAQTKLAPVRAFLMYAKKNGLVKTSLAPHLGSRKASPKAGKNAKKDNKQDSVVMTQVAYDRLTAELDELKKERPRMAEEIHRAAADKDFRENAPLEAAKERQGHVEGRIRELETTLGAAAVLEEKTEKARRARINCSLLLCDLASGVKVTYTLVGPREIAPLEGKISVLSPIGKALVNHQEGETVEVSAPSGKLTYRIERIASL